MESRTADNNLVCVQLDTILACHNNPIVKDAIYQYDAIDNGSAELFYDTFYSEEVFEADQQKRTRNERWTSQIQGWVKKTLLLLWVLSHGPITVCQ